MKSALVTITRIGLGLVLLIAGATKLAHPADFFADLVTYRVPFPELFLRVVAVELPWLEVFCGIGLLLDFWSETVRPMVALLGVVFVAMLGQALIRGLDLDCGCFGRTSYQWLERPGFALARAVVLLAAALWLTTVNARSCEKGKTEESRRVIT